jgi:hypothetical protein
MRTENPTYFSGVILAAKPQLHGVRSGESPGTARRPT